MNYIENEMEMPEQYSGKKASERRSGKSILERKEYLTRRMEEFDSENSHKMQFRSLGYSDNHKSEGNIFVKAFVSEDGNITKKYSLKEKVNLFFLKTTKQKRKHSDAKTYLDNRIINDCAYNKIQDLEETYNKTLKQLNRMKTLADRYYERHEEMDKKYISLLNHAEEFKAARDLCSEELEEMRSLRLEDQSNEEYCSKFWELKQLFTNLQDRVKDSTADADDVNEMIRMNHPQYIEARMYEQTLDHHVRTVKKQINFFKNVYASWKEQRDIDLEQFNKWNAAFDKFVVEYNEQIKQNETRIRNVLDNYQESDDMSKGDEILNDYSRTLTEQYDARLKRLEKDRKNIINMKL